MRAFGCQLRASAGDSMRRLSVMLVAIQLLFSCSCCSFALLSPEQHQVKRHLGYVPSNFDRIAVFTATGEPLVLQTYPIAGGSPRRQRRSDSATPFSTLFWLCNRPVNRAVADLERQGQVKSISERIRNSSELSAELADCHGDYARQRWEALTETDRLALPTNVIGMLRDSGIAGTAISNAFTPPIKCLHAHYAHYRATNNNPVGRLVHEILTRDYPHLDL